MNLLERLLYEFDVFKSPFSFSLDKKNDKIASKLGSFLSIIIILILFILFIRSDLIMKTNPSTLSQNKAISFSPKIDLNASKFQLFFGIFDANLKPYLIDPTLFYMDIVQLDVVMNTSDINDERTSYINNSSKAFKECLYFDTKNRGYCVTDDVVVQGYFNENRVNTVSIRLFPCNNRTSNNTCKSDEEFMSFFQNKRLGVIYQNNNFNFNDYRNPIYQSSYTEQLFVDPTISKNLNIFIKKAEFSDDDNFFFQELKVSETYMRDYTRLDFSELLPNFSQNTPFAKVMFWSSNNIVENSRKYQKIDELFASLTGIANFFMLIFLFLTKAQQNLNLKKFLMMELYNFKIEAESNENKRFIPSPTCSQSVSVKLENAKKVEDSELELQNSKKPFHEKNSAIKEKVILERLEQKDIKDTFFLERFSLQNLREKNATKKSLDFNIFEYFKTKLKKFFSISCTLPEKNFLELEEEFFNFSNLKFIFKLLQDIEKIKILIMNEEQLKIFELMPNLLVFSSEKSRISQSDYFRVYHELKSFTNKTSKDSKILGDLIQNLKKQRKASKIDQKFINFFS